MVLEGKTFGVGYIGKITDTVDTDDHGINVGGAYCSHIALILVVKMIDIKLGNATKNVFYVKFIYKFIYILGPFLKHRNACRRVHCLYIFIFQGCSSSYYCPA